MALGIGGRQGRRLRSSSPADDALGRDFRHYLCAQATSQTGTQMASLAISFAVLAAGGGGGGLGLVMGARILPLVLVLLLGGTAADRWGSRRVMLGADTLRCVTQAAFAALLLTAHRPSVAAMVPLAALSGVGEAAFGPGQSALLPRLVPAAGLLRANALLGTVRSAAVIVGPVLAGVLVAAAGPGVVLVVDAASFGVSTLVLWRLPVGRRAVTTDGDEGGEGGEVPGFLADLRAGWGEFRSRGWLWITTAHFALFNLLLWAPYLVLGPVIAAQRLGGAGAWGAVAGAYGAGALCGGLGLGMVRSLRRPLRAGVLLSACFVGAPGALALGLPLAWVCGGAVLSGVSSAVCGALLDGFTQQRVPAQVLGRVSAYTSVGSYVLGPIGLVVAGPLAAVVGAPTVLGAGAMWLLASTVLVAALPAVRSADCALPRGARNCAASHKPR
ncbi:MFS transporter [Streptacidiphilus fuscans]|uniref:MFS transporter n=1 Tax=Streptacidiphilus fuscans TaxID=2789292 RepID=A0A931B7A9_9ACTN|nr:MFS transporter [Streptacidiphilus fuscans]MBF9069987.1 MFS transporter [Streptacidiphilus fuscans]